MLVDKENELLSAIEQTLVKTEDNTSLDLSPLIKLWEEYLLKYEYFDPETERIILKGQFGDIELLKLRVGELEDIITETIFSCKSDSGKAVHLEMGYINYCKTFNLEGANNDK